MPIEEQVNKAVEKYGPRLEPIQDFLANNLKCYDIIFWGVKGEGHPYVIEFKHEEKQYKTGPYQFTYEIKNQ